VILNRERIACGLSLLILVFGLYWLANSRILAPPPPKIDTTLPAWSQSMPQIEPRLYVDDLGGDANPFEVLSEWTRITPADLPAPAPEPSRWVAVPLGRSADPADVGYLFLKDPPVELKEEDGQGAAPAGDKTQ